VELFIPSISEPFPLPRIGEKPSQNKVGRLRLGATVIDAGLKSKYRVSRLRDGRPETNARIASPGRGIIAAPRDDTIGYVKYNMLSMGYRAAALAINSGRASQRNAG
jgi:hypothetical protein